MLLVCVFSFFFCFLFLHEHAVHRDLWRSVNGQSWQFPQLAPSALTEWTQINFIPSLPMGLIVDIAQSRSCSRVILSKFIIKSFFHVWCLATLVERWRPENCACATSETMKRSIHAQWWMNHSMIEPDMKGSRLQLQSQKTRTNTTAMINNNKN